VSDKIPEGLEVQDARKKPVTVQTVLVTPDNLASIVEWIVINGHHAVLDTDQLTIQTLEGPFVARPGDQVMRGIQGEFYRHEGGDFFKEAYDIIGPHVSTDA